MTVSPPGLGKVDLLARLDSPILGADVLAGALGPPITDAELDHARSALDAARRSGLPGIGVPNPSPEYRALSPSNRAVVDRLNIAPGGITAAHARVARDEAQRLQADGVSPVATVREANNFAAVLGQAYTRAALVGVTFNPTRSRDLATTLVTSDLSRPHLVQALTDLRPTTAATLFSALEPGAAFGQQGDLARVLLGDATHPGLSQLDLAAVQARLDQVAPLDGDAFGRYVGRTSSLV